MARRFSYNIFEKSYDEVAEFLKDNDVIMIPMGSTEKTRLPLYFGDGHGDHHGGGASCRRTGQDPLLSDHSGGLFAAPIWANPAWGPAR